MPKRSTTEGIRKKRKPKPKEKNSRYTANQTSFKPGHAYYFNPNMTGKPVLFTAEELKQKAIEYFQWVQDNPWYKAEAVKSGKNVGKIIYTPSTRPYSIVGFCLFCGATDKWWYDFIQSKTVKNDPTYSYVIRAIENTIREQKFDGAAQGFFNAMIISRDLGLVEHVDNTSGGKPIEAPAINVIQGNAPPLPDSESRVDLKRKDKKK